MIDQQDQEPEKIKTILVDLEKKEKKIKQESVKNRRSWIGNVQMGYDPKKRVVVETKRWNKTVTEEHDKDQYRYLLDQSDLVKEQIHTKIKGYRYQDLLKKLYYEPDFVDYPYVIELLKACELKCFYCHLDCMILYPYVREPRQWTLERINNDIGHNKGNVQIACLDCNLRRRTIHHERYLDTKKIANICKLTEASEASL